MQFILAFFSHLIPLKYNCKFICKILELHTIVRIVVAAYREKSDSFNIGGITAAINSKRWFGLNAKGNLGDERLWRLLGHFRNNKKKTIESTFFVSVLLSFRVGVFLSHSRTRANIVLNIT